MSSKELSDTRLISAVIERLQRNSRHVLLELTESLELQQSADVRNNLARLRQADLRIAIDDFGAGYSNSTRLELLRPTLLKTDRSLVVLAADDADQGGVFLRAAAALADSLDCQVVVEGIETNSQQAVARAAGARYVQGFLYARPEPVQRWLTVPVSAASECGAVTDRPLTAP